MKREPLLSVGTFGTHLLLNPAGLYSFAGTVPLGLGNVRTETYAEAFDAFRDWFLALPVEEQREYAPNLRNDAFVRIFQTGNK
jgi:hypothetical protein